MSDDTSFATRPLSIPGLELQEKIGDGGLSVVYRAVHVNLGRTVAVKILRHRDGHGETSPDWLREPRLMAELAHPHVVTIHDAGEVDEHAYLVMEYMAGGSLRSRIQPGRPWTVDEAVPVLEQIAEALEHIHERGVLHLDLKPENILFADDEQICISDFGLSLPHTEVGSPVDGQPMRGTAVYCPPEQRSGVALDARCDVFALATVAYELLTGRLPGRLYVPASSHNPRLPAELDDVLRRGLSRHREDRYESVAEFRRELIDACRASVGGRRTWWRPAIVALAAVVTLLFLFQGMRAGGSRNERATGLWALFDDQEDLALLTNDGDPAFASNSRLAFYRIDFGGSPGNVPPHLSLPFWPQQRPLAIVRSPSAWGFVVPLETPKLVRQTLESWPMLLRHAASPDENLIQAGGFDGDCLSMTHRGQLWRVSHGAGTDRLRRMKIDRQPDDPENPALVHANMDPARADDLLGGYQMIQTPPDPGSIVVLRYRARSERGAGRLAAYFAMSITLDADETGPAARKIRRNSQRIASGTGYAATDRWDYPLPVWVTPTTDWLTYLVIMECPSIPNDSLDCKLAIVAKGTDEIWVDDVELFAWPGEIGR